MSTDPIAIALREIAETKTLLESLILSSESFDYPKAKAVLKLLDHKLRDLCRLEAQFRQNGRIPDKYPPNVHVLDFKHPPRISRDLPTGKP